MKRAITLLMVLLGMAAVPVLAALFYYVGVTANVRLDPDKLTPDTAFAELYDGDGRPIECAAAQGDVPGSDIPDHVKNAFVAVEDKRFYRHSGLDLRRIAAAVVHNLTRRSFSEGASTISQQLIKNTHLTNEKTIARKLKELKLTRALEKRYTKEEILERYLNSIYFGHKAFGIGGAAAFYFGKQPSDLSVAEGAMLAALIRSPNRYSPFRDPEKCRARRDLVLRLMREQDYLTGYAYRAAAAESLPEQPAEQTKNAYCARVYEELAALIPERACGGWNALRVYTYCDGALQRAAESLACDTDLCAVVRDNAQNALLALHATAGTPKRPPASIIKPLLVYAPALEENLISPATPVADEKTDFGGYAPDDYGGARGGYMSVREALAHSANIPAVKLLNCLGVDRAAAYLQRMGLAVGKRDRSLALALGAMEHGFTLPQLADAYATFANEGMFAPASAIRRIEDRSGKVLYEHRPATRRVFSEDVCYLMNDMLQTAAREGTAKKLKTLPFPVCAKTGTAGAKDKNTDAYCIGYTKDTVAAVWMGNADNTPVAVTGGGAPAGAVQSLLKTIAKKRKPSAFAACEQVVRLRYDRQIYLNEHAVVLSDPAAPPYDDPAELFRRCAQPTKTSTRFSHPHIAKPRIEVQNGAVNIILCQAEYYDYEIKRENRGKYTTIYSGKYCKIIRDNSVCAGERYEYSVTPLYNGRRGDTVVLPQVSLPGPHGGPDDWWKDDRSPGAQIRTASSDVIASATSPSMSSFFSSSSINESLGFMAGNSGKNTVQQSS